MALKRSANNGARYDILYVNTVFKLALPSKETLTLHLPSTLTVDLIRYFILVFCFVFATQILAIATVFRVRDCCYSDISFREHSAVCLSHPKGPMSNLSGFPRPINASVS